MNTIGQREKEKNTFPKNICILNNTMTNKLLLSEEQKEGKNFQSKLCKSTERQAGSTKSVYLPAGRQGGVVKGGGGEGGQEEAEPEQEHS